MTSFRAVRRALCTAAEAAPAPAPAPAPAGRWERLKQSKVGVFCRSLLSDYKEACREVVVGARERPLKASVYMGLLGGAYACFATKPDQSSFQAALLDRSNQLALLSPWIRNGASDLHVQNLAKLQNQGRLRHLSLGLVSLVYSADFDPQSALYEATCSNLSVPWRELPERVLDVGFAGRWWLLDRKMEDYDVNDAEYKHLPAHMQATAPPSVQEVERNEKLHKDSWLPVVQVEQEDKTAETKKVDTAEETQTRTEDVKVDTQTTETLDIKEEVKQEDLIEDSLEAQTSDTQAETDAGQTLDTSASETGDETEETRPDTKEEAHIDEIVDAVAMKTVDTSEDVEQPPAQSMQN